MYDVGVFFFFFRCRFDDRRTLFPRGPLSPRSPRSLPFGVCTGVKCSGVTVAPRLIYIDAKLLLSSLFPVFISPVNPDAFIPRTVEGPSDSS